MYRSQEYMEIGGKLITSPYGEEDQMHGINLHHLLCELHASGAVSRTDIESVILGAIECKCPLRQEGQICDVFTQVMTDLHNLGVIKDKSAH